LRHRGCLRGLCQQVTRIHKRLLADGRRARKGGRRDGAHDLDLLQVEVSSGVLPSCTQEGILGWRELNCLVK